MIERSGFKQMFVGYLGRLTVFPHFSIQNFLGPLEPLRAEKPSYGIDDVPVTNCKSLNLLSLSNLLMAVQNQMITG